MSCWWPVILDLGFLSSAGSHRIKVKSSDLFYFILSKLCRGGGRTGRDSGSWAFLSSAGSRRIKVKSSNLFIFRGGGEGGKWKGCQAVVEVIRAL